MATHDESQATERTVRFVDTTLRDANQSLWASRMTTPMILPVCERINQTGYAAVDLMGIVQFDVCVRDLKEDPWERIRLVRERITDVPLKSYVGSKNFFGFSVVPDDVIALWIDRLVANGIGMVCAFDALADIDNIVSSLKVAKELGAKTCGALLFCESPVHTDAFFAAKARELVERADVDWLMVKDSSGLLGIDRVRTLIPALRIAVGDKPIELHSHCLTGITPLVYHEGVKLGVDIIDTSVSPLANGPAQPATQTIARNLKELRFDVQLDMQAVDEVGKYFRHVAEQEGKQLGVPLAYDSYYYEHQVSGDDLRHLTNQLKSLGMKDRLPDVLEECSRVRADLGWPVMVTPFSQLVITQATLNVVHGERYKIVPDEVKKYALGHYGRLPAPVAGDTLDRVVENGSDQISSPPAKPEPAIPHLRRKYLNMTDEERLLRFCLSSNAVDELHAAGSMRAHYAFELPIKRLIKELRRRKSWHYVRVQDSTVDLIKRSKEVPRHG